MTVTADYLRSVLRYDPDSGAFYWLAQSQRNRRLIGTIAGTTLKNGYVIVRIHKKHYYAHRLAFLYMIGVWPLEQIDHIDGNPNNNRWTNLRISNQTENMRNARRPAHNTSGIKGVSWDKRRQKWRAYIVVKRKQRLIGYFELKGDAAIAYAQAAIDTFGTFARIE